MIPNICIFSLYIFFPNIFMFAQCVELPRLLVDFPKEWERISLADAVDNAYYRDWDFFAGDNLKLKCDAPYPIQWNITGFFSRVDDVKIYQTSFSPEEKLYHNQMHMDFSKLSDSLRNVAISIKVACQMIGNSEISNAVRLFTKSADENPTLYAPSGMKSGKLVVTESTLLPCITTNPLTPVYLYQVTDVRLK